MSDENLESVAQTEDQELESAMAGYNSTARVEETPAEVVEPEVEQVEEAGPTLEDELKALKEKVHGMAESADPSVVRRMHGEIGNINRTLQQLQSAPKAESAPAEKAAALVLKRLSNEYPELAETLAEDMSEVLQEALAKRSSPSVDINAQVSAEVMRVRKLDAYEALTEDHPDHEAVSKSPEFHAWLKTKPVEYQERILNTWNPATASKGLTEFKSHQTAQSNTRERKQNRLASAVTPQGSSQQGRASTLPDEEGYNAGYYGKARKRQ